MPSSGSQEFKHSKLAAKQNVQLWLIKPSNYDDEGYVVTHFRSVLPSNTLNCLAALTQDVLSRRLLDEDVAVTLHLLDETVQTIPVEKICRKAGKSQGRTVVCLVGVQTNQFPRACDLARAFRKADITVLIGGFHVRYLQISSNCWIRRSQNWSPFHFGSIYQLGGCRKGNDGRRTASDPASEAEVPDGCKIQVLY